MEGLFSIGEDDDLVSDPEKPISKRVLHPAFTSNLIPKF